MSVLSSLCRLPGNLMAAKRLQEVTAPGLEIVLHITPVKTTTSCFLHFKLKRDYVLMTEL